MSKTDIAFAVYDRHSQAESAVKKLQRTGFDMKKISIVGKDYEAEEHVAGYFNAGDRAKSIYAHSIPQDRPTQNIPSIHL